MIRTLTEQYELENQRLAPYAVKNTLGSKRRFPEEPHPFRTDFQRDRDRILHSRSFRRLEYKSQVFLNGTGDHLRTRLTHTIEVAAIARTIARTFKLNEDLTEAIALAHDIGHTPFGHPGESVMNTIMKGEGGFDHNEQSLRIVDILERKYPEYEGLNLTYELRAGLVKRRNPNKAVLDGEKLPPQPSLESQVADIADDITYYGHDIDDGLEAGLLTDKMLSSLEIWEMATDEAAKRGLRHGEKFQVYAVRCLIDMMVRNVVIESEKNLKKYNIKTSNDAQNSESKLISFDEKFSDLTNKLRKFLYENLYYHPSVSDVNNEASDKIRDLFRIYCENPKEMGTFANSRIKKDGLKRAVADYVAGMTDRFAILEHKRLFS